ncbi:MAG: hypothetical protein ABI635_05490 [Actinomycetota bacterium]
MSPPCPRGAAWFLGAVCVLTSCTPARTGAAESGRPQPSPATSFVIPSPILAPRPFTQDDLSAIVLGRRDTPPGTEFAPQYSVDQTIDQFASDAEELTALRQDRFVGAHTALFVPKDQLGDPTLHARHGATFVQSIAAVFETPEGADSTLLRYVANLRAFELTDEVRIDADGLGASSEGLRGLADGEKVTVYAWRTGNLVLVVTGSGTIPVGDVRALADVMQDRADLAR